MELDFEKLKTVLKEKHPVLFKTNKHFWNKEFVPFMIAFNESQKVHVVIDEFDQPFTVDRCPKCKSMIIPGDKFCSCCGVSFTWN